MGSGGKKTFKRYLKSEQTHRLTDNQLIESIGPEGRFLENLKKFNKVKKEKRKKSENTAHFTINGLFTIRTGNSRDSSGTRRDKQGQVRDKH